MKRSTDRILTTHGGSLARPSGLLDLMKAEANGQHVDPVMPAARVQQAVADVVAQQRACGIDLVSDGEQSKPGFFSYVAERLGGFEAQAGRGLDTYRAEVEAFPEYYEQYFQTAMLGGMRWWRCWLQGLAHSGDSAAVRRPLSCSGSGRGCHRDGRTSCNS